MDVSSSSRSSSISDVSSDRLNVDFPNNLIDIYIDETEVIDMDVDGVDVISVRSIPDVAPDYFERYVGVVVTVSSLVDSDSDHGGDLASLSSFSDSDSDSVAVTSETQDVSEENEEVFEENEAEVASNPSLFGSDRGDVALDAEIADLLVVFEDELANIRAEYEEELEENQEELASNPEENEEQLEENQEDFANNLEENEEELEENQVELASNPSFANVSSLLGDSDIESIVDETQAVLEGSEDGHASITDLLASEASSGSIVVIDLDDDDVEAMVEDVDEVIVGDDDEVMVVDDDEVMVAVDLVSNSNSQLSAIHDVEENVILLTAVVLPTVSVASSDSSTQGVLDDHLEAVELRRNREQFLQSAPVAAASTDSAPSLTPLQEHNFRINIEQIRLRELRREAAELQAQVDEQELAVDQHTGYGIVQGNLDYIPDIEGVLPKLPSFQLTFNWLTNIENNFNLFI